MLELENIPAELKQYRQWIVWRIDLDDSGKHTKIPYSAAYRGQMASVSKPDTWSDFATAAKLFMSNPTVYAGVGFVLTKGDPFCFIDLDDAGADVSIFQQQKRVFDHFVTYAEHSPSGKGLHIICRGSIPQGRRRNKIEIYSDSRWMTMTGRVMRDRNLPIVDCNDLCHTLFSQMGKDDVRGFYDPKAPQTEDDATVCNNAANAGNGSLFLDLMRGDWQSHPEYPSQSEADQALINIIAFYTQNRQQITRIFLSSGLGKREKSKRKEYLNWTINKAFDMLLPPVDIEGLAAVAKRIVEQQAKKGDAPSVAEQEHQTGATSGVGRGSDGASSPAGSDGAGGAHTGEEAPYSPIERVSNPQEPQGSPDAPRPIEYIKETYAARGEEVPLHFQKLPPGLLGEIANFIYLQSPRKVPEAALTAAIGFMAGICGRCFNVSGSGLNQYVLFLAQTGAGKESINSGIDKILGEVRQQVPTVDEFFGPSYLGSGQAVLKALDETPCFVSIVGEFDNMLKQMVEPNANSAMIVLKRVILDLYQKSGRGRVSRKMIYSDTAKNTGNVDSPAFSILGECTPQLLFQSVSEELVTSGLLPRFTIIEYKGKINYLDRDAKNHKPSSNLIGRCSELAEYAMRLNNNKQVVDVQLTPEADDMLIRFERSCTDNINATTVNTAVNLWNRAHLKTLKLAATIAVGVNPYQPIIDLPCAEYAKSLIMYDITNLLQRFEGGNVGAQITSDDSGQRLECGRAIKHFLTQPLDKTLIAYGITQQMLDFRCIPYAYFSRRMFQRSVFRKDRMGATFAIKRTLKQMCDENLLREIPKAQVSSMFNGSIQIMYAIPDPAHILEAFTIPAKHKVTSYTSE